MIPFDFEYYRPDTLQEMTKIYSQLVKSNKITVYYGGGTELISMARAGTRKFNAVIDTKNIPDCNQCTMNEKSLIIGSAVTLTQIAESGYFPLLGDTVSRIADHTIQDKITIGGNIAGTIIYREAALPLMLTDSRVQILKKNGKIYEISFSTVFDGRLHLKEGECILQFIIDKEYVNLPYNHVKKTKIEKIDYPLLTFTAIKYENSIRAAVSGLFDHPYLLPSNMLSSFETSLIIRIENTIHAVKDMIHSDLSGSKEYRMFVLSNVLRQMYDNFKEL